MQFKETTKLPIFTVITFCGERKGANCSDVNRTIAVASSRVLGGAKTPV